MCVSTLCICFQSEFDFTILLIFITKLLSHFSRISMANDFFLFLTAPKTCLYCQNKETVQF